MMYDLIIVGAGAAGLVAAYYAKQNLPQLNILVLEKEAIPGRKLNATGNGKCNVTNSAYSEAAYFADSDTFIHTWCKSHSYKQMLSLFEQAGILLYEKNGYYYPFSNQAKQVSQHLFEKARMQGVTYIFDTKVTDIHVSEKNSSTYLVTTVQNDKIRTYKATYILVATGGLAAPKLGGTKHGYKMLEHMGLQMNPLYPVLSPMYIDDSNLSIAKGVRIDGNVTLKLQDGSTYKEAGQIQFNDNNVSGIVIMNLSCYWNRQAKKNEQGLLYIDMIPGLTWDFLKELFLKEKDKAPDEKVAFMLEGLLPKPMVRYILKRCNVQDALLLNGISEKQVNRIVSTIKKLEFQLQYVEDYEKAQVTGGGIATDMVSVNSFECKKYSNFYVVGEVLDVHAKCGGYNLTFAMLSALQAVEDIIHKVKVND